MSGQPKTTRQAFTRLLPDSALAPNPHRSEGNITINVSLSRDEVRKANEAAKGLGINRSAYIRQLINKDALNGMQQFALLRNELQKVTESAITELRREHAILIEHRKGLKKSTGTKGRASTQEILPAPAGGPVSR